MPNRIRLNPRFVNALRHIANLAMLLFWPYMGIPVPRPDSPTLSFYSHSNPCIDAAHKGYVLSATLFYVLIHASGTLPIRPKRASLQRSQAAASSTFVDDISVTKGTF